MRRFFFLAALCALVGCNLIFDMPPPPDYGAGNASASATVSSSSGTGGEGGDATTTTSTGTGAAGGGGSPETGTLWAHGYGDDDVQAALAVAVDPAGNAYVAGEFWGSMQVGDDALVSSGGRDVFVAKLGPDGAPIWAKAFGLVDDVHQVVDGIAADASGVALVGSASAPSGPVIDFGGGPLAKGIYVARLDTDGGHVWSRSCGGIGGDGGIALDSTGAVVITSTAKNTVDCGGGAVPAISTYGDVLVARFESDGQVDWARRFGVAGSPNRPHGVAVAADGSVVLTGWLEGSVSFGGTTLTANGPDVFLVKLGSDGDHVWSKRFGIAGAQVGYAVALDATGGPVVVGAFEGGVAFGGAALSSGGGNDVFVAKFTAGGDHVWSKSYGKAEDQAARGVAVDGDGNVVFVGEMAGAAAFSDETVLESAGGLDAFAAKLDPGGALVWAQRFGAIGDDRALGVDVDGDGNAIVVGDYGAEVDFGTGPVANAGQSDAFVMKLAP